MRNVNIIGNLWPRCKTCGHIAQAHGENDCSELVRCPNCNHIDSRVRCACKAYVGPTLEQFMQEYLTPEERDYYSKQWRLTDGY